MPMRTVRWLPLLLLSSVAGFAHAADKTETQMLDEHLQVVRGDIAAKRDSAIKTLVQVDEQHAAEFRTLKEQYDAELKKLSEARQALIREFVSGRKTLTPEKARDLATRSLDLDDKRNALRRKYFDLMATQVSPVAAAQFLQVERQFETMADLKVATAMPLVGE
jgi:hypothetical protein